MATINDQQAMGNNQAVIAHVFAGPIPMTDSSNAVTTSASSVTLTAGKVYRFVSDVNTYFQFNNATDSDVTADTGSMLIAEVPEVFRCPKGRTTLSLLGTASGTVRVNEVGV